MSNAVLVESLRSEGEVLRQQLIAKRAQAKDSSLTRMAANRNSLPRFKLSMTKEFRGHAGRVMEIRLSSDGRFMVSCGGDGYMVLWDTASAEKIDLVKVHNGYGMAVAISPSSQIFAEGGLGNGIAVYAIHLGNRRLSSVKSSSGIESRNSLVKYKAMIQTAAASGDFDRSPLVSLKGHRAHVGSLDFFDDSTLASGSGDFTIKIWDIMHSKLISELCDHCACIDTVRVSPTDRNTFMTSASDGLVKIWDIRTYRSQITLPIRTNDIICSRWFPGGNSFAVGCEDGSIRLMDIRCDCPVDIYSWNRGSSSSSEFSATSATALERYSTGSSVSGATLSTMEFAGSGRSIAVGYSDGSIALLDILKNEWISHLANAHANRIQSFAIGGDKLFSSSFDGMIKGWSAF